MGPPAPAVSSRPFGVGCDVGGGVSLLLEPLFEGQQWVPIGVIRGNSRLLQDQRRPSLTLINLRGITQGYNFHLLSEKPAPKFSGSWRLEPPTAAYPHAHWSMSKENCPNQDPEKVTFHGNVDRRIHLKTTWLRRQWFLELAQRLLVGPRALKKPRCDQLGDVAARVVNVLYIYIPAKPVPQ